MTTKRKRKDVAEPLTPEGHETALQAQLDELFGGKPAATRPPTKVAPLLGNFGVDERDNEPHFLVDVPRARSGVVRLWEVRQTVDDALVRLPRAELNRTQWDAIAVTMEHEFNRELAEEGQRLGRFRKTGETRLSLSNLGKEMMVLAWAIEELPETDLSTVRAAWLNLHRIERWWLFNMTVAINGHVSNRGHGWRAALMHALSARPADPERERQGVGTTIQLKELPRERKRLQPRQGLDPLFRKKGVA